MRKHFVAALQQLFSEQDRLMLLTADLGYGVFDELIRCYPDRYLNVGVAEQNMIGVATGLAMEGWRIVAYSIGNFPTLRCLEQLRNDACYHQVNLTIVASGGGLTYGAMGMSHHATEDLSILRGLPGLTLVAPCDGWESGEATRALLSQDGVGYLRLEKDAPLNTQCPGESFQLGKARRLREGRDLTLLCIGGITLEALKAAEELARQGIEARVVSCHTLKPLDREEILSAGRDTGGIFTIEENTILGGLGGAVAEILLEEGILPKFFKRLGLPDTYCSLVGSQNYLRQHFGLDHPSIVRQTLKQLGG